MRISYLIIFIVFWGYGPLPAEGQTLQGAGAFYNLAFPASGGSSSTGGGLDSIRSMRIWWQSQNDLNTGTAGSVNRIELSAIEYSSIPGAFLTSNALTLPPGKYMLNQKMSTSMGSGHRPNINWRLVVNGQIHTEPYGGNYIRGAEGHNEAGDGVLDEVILPTGGTLEFFAIPTASLGETVNLSGGNGAPNRSWINIWQLAAY